MVDGLDVGLLGSVLHQEDHTGDDESRRGSLEQVDGELPLVADGGLVGDSGGAVDDSGVGVHLVLLS